MFGHLRCWQRLRVAERMLSFAETRARFVESCAAVATSCLNDTVYAGRMQPAMQAASSRCGVAPPAQKAAAQPLHAPKRRAVSARAVAEMPPPPQTFKAPTDSPVKIGINGARRFMLTLCRIQSSIRQSGTSTRVVGQRLQRYSCHSSAEMHTRCVVELPAESCVELWARAPALSRHSRASRHCCRQQTFHRRRM